MSRCMRVLAERSVRNCTILVLLLHPFLAFAQVSFYTSLGYGYDQNPLYNYQLLPDQTRTGYVEADYLHQTDLSNLTFQYVGGLGMFNHFSPRDFYEHRLGGSYSVDVNSTPNNRTVSGKGRVTEDDTLQSSDDSLSVQDSSSSSIDSNSGNVHTASPPDTVDDYVGIGGMVGARHDRQAFEQFDNIAGSASASYRFAFTPRTYFRIENTLGGRSFTHLVQLSHVDDVLSLELGRHDASLTTLAFEASIGEKYYTVSQYDTTQFERTRSFVPNGQGKGKTGAILVPSQKKIFIQPQGNGTVQSVLGALLGYQLDGITTFWDFAYRWNLKSATRYLALTSSASLFSKNIYDDVFSYQGPGVTFTANGKWIAQLQWILTMNYQLENYGVPALSLIGQTIASRRTDKHGSVELYVSDPLVVQGDTQLEVFIDATWVSNRSNDQYNNFASSAISGGLGIDF